MHGADPTGTPAVRLARLLSILLHPLVSAPASGMLAWGLAGGSVALVPYFALGSAALALLVMGFSWRRVRRGAWSHVDASDRAERRELNGFLAVVLPSAALAAWALGAAPPVPVALLACAGMVVVARAAGRWCKPSLHVAFAVFGAVLLQGASAPAAGATALLAAAVGWSRLVLQRHVPADIVAGTAIGLAAGVAFRLAVAG